MKRKDILKEFLITIFGSTTVKPVSGKIYCSGNLFSSCKFDDSDYSHYVKLLKIAFLDDSPKIQNPNYEPTVFNREESISRFITYLESYKENISFPKADDKTTNKFAYKAAITILSAIFTKSNNSDKFVIEGEDISVEFREALESIKYIPPINKLLEDIESERFYYFYDTDYIEDKSKYNYCLSVNAIEDVQFVLRKIDHQYKCKNEEELKAEINRKALTQYEDYIAQLMPEYEISLVSYTEDLIKRVMNLDLTWLYSDAQKKVEKCRKEVEKVIIGYQEIYTYIDSCPENIIIQQLLTILHHVVVEITNFIDCHDDYIAECALKHQCLDHVKYMKGKINSNKFKEFKELSENIPTRDNEELKCLGEAYYYTSGNELGQLLDALQEYYNSLKKS